MIIFVDDDYHDEEVKTETFGHSKKNHIKKIKLDGRIERLRQEKIQRASQLSHPSKQKIVLTKQKSKVEM